MEITFLIVENHGKIMELFLNFCTLIRGAAACALMFSHEPFECCIQESDQEIQKTF